MPNTSGQSIYTGGGASSASAVSFDNASSGSPATNVQDALDQLFAKAPAPVGSIIMWGTGTPPAGYYEANGAAIDAALDPNLAAVYGANLPDLRGEFIRGFDNGRGIDAGRAVGSFQDHQTVDHTHGPSNGTAGGLVTQTNGAGSFNDGTLQAVAAGGTPVGLYATTGLINTDPASAGSVPANIVGGEARPRNVALMFIVKHDER